MPRGRPRKASYFQSQHSVPNKWNSCQEASSSRPKVEIIKLTVCPPSVPVSVAETSSIGTYNVISDTKQKYVDKELAQSNEHCNPKSDSQSEDEELSFPFGNEMFEYDVQYYDFEHEKYNRKRKFLENWKSVFPFIEYDSEQNIMYCKICNEYAEECHRAIPFVCGTNNFRASSIQYHERSAVHAKCQKLAAEVEVEHNPKACDIVENHNIHREKLMHVLKSVYFIVKTKSPYSYFPYLCELQKKDGVDVGAAYTTHHKVVPNFAEYIALAFEKEFAEKIKNVEIFSLILDGSFDRSVENHELVYINVLENGCLKTYFFGVIDSKGQTSKDVFDSLSKLFQKFGISNWTDKLIGITTDGATIYHGWNTGLMELLKEICPNYVVGLHCLAHKIEVSAKEVIQCNVGAVEFAAVIWDIYWFYTKLAEEQKVLRDIGEELDSLIAKFGNLPKNKWVTFYYRALFAIDANWASLVNLLRTERDAPNFDKKTKKAGVKILSVITRSSFICKLAVLLDLFTCLENLSEQMQKKDCLIYSAIDEVHRTCGFIQKAARGEGIKVLQFTEEFFFQPCTFRNEEIKVDTSMSQVLSEMDNIGTVLCMHLKSMTENLSSLKDTVIFDTSSWPKSEELDTFGNDQLKDLLTKFHCLKDKNLEIALSEWCFLKKNVYLPEELKLNPKAAISKMILDLKDGFPIITEVLEKLMLIDVSFTEAENGYLQMNLIKSSMRSTLSVSSLHNSMMIALHGPEQSQFNPVPALDLWMSQCNRRYIKRTDCRKRRCKREKINEDENDFLYYIDNSEIATM